MTRMKFIGMKENMPFTALKAMWNENRPFRLIKSDAFPAGRRSTVWTRETWPAKQPLICDGWQINPDPNH